MKVAWVSHQLPRDSAEAASEHPGLLPGRYAGGAELLQDKMRSRAPEGVEWVLVDPRKADDELSALEGCERVIVGASESLRPAQLHALRPHRPMVWFMSPQAPRSLPLMEMASPLVWASAAMRDWYPWAPHGEVCQGWFDTSEVPYSEQRDGTALWAARNHPQKGRLNARVWAAQRGLTLREMTDAPRSEVLQAMSTASHFVLLANDYDPGPIACLEAAIAGCEVHTNRKVGRAPVEGRQATIEWVESMPGRFYGWL